LIVIIDTGTANVASIQNMLHRCGVKSVLAKKPEDAYSASKLILPGVGSFDNAMTVLTENRWIEFIQNFVIDERKPILGICLGMQLLTRGSEEGIIPGLNLINADTRRFDEKKMVSSHLIPHMGWNLVSKQKDMGLFDTDDKEERFYFVHSYHVICDNDEDVLTTTNHGYEFVSSFKKGNITGVQFHPEKSHKFGFNFFKKFLAEDFQ